MLFILLYKVIISFESLDEILKTDHSNESYCDTLLWCCLLCRTVLSLRTEILRVLNTLVVLLIMLYKAASLTSVSVDDFQSANVFYPAVSYL